MTAILSSRRNILALALGLWLVLDLGRSLYARVAYNRPFEAWSGAPYDLQLDSWPPAATAPPGASLGEQVFVANCAVCHGTAGRGNGVSAPSMHPRPLDFTLGQFKYQTTPAGQPPSDADLIRTVANGLTASAMPYFGDVLSAEEIAAVVVYVKSFSDAVAGSAPEAMALPPRVPPDAASLERGRWLFATHCAACHGTEGNVRALLKDSNGHTVHARDLTAPWTFRGGSRPEQVWLRISTGMAPSPMPAFADSLSDDERWDLVNYLESIARLAPWEPGGQLAGPGAHPDPVKRGEYITQYGMCGLCHTQVGGFGIYRDEKYLGGGMLVEAYPHGVFVSRNLTSDPTGLGNKSEAEIVNIIRNGQASDRSVSLWAMPWMVLHNLSDEDALAMARYLKTLPPVQGQAPPAMEYGFVETTVMKLVRGLPVAPPETLTYGTGSYANPSPGALPDDWPRRVLVWAQAITPVGGLGLGWWAGPREKRFPRGFKGWLLSGLGTMGALLAAVILTGIYNLPSILPPAAVAEAVRTGLHEVQPDDFETPEAYALAQRGQYLYTTVACMFCHGANGQGGGKLNGQGVGTIWTPNISQHAVHGIGAWTDAEIARAIRSGVSADGRPPYWQGMPWDHFSNLDEEDVRALVAYLRTIPPVDARVPEAAPPSSNDCSVYTFWVTPNHEPGCR